MKKILSILLCICMMLPLHATDLDTHIFDYEEQGVTIVFDENTTLPQEERQYIADRIVYEDTDMEGTSTYAWCWLTGHDITSEAVIAIEHKASSTVPRCYQTVYQVDTCSNCDYMETTVLSQMYINCCPAD